VTGNQDVACLTAQPVADPRRRVVRLKVASRGALGKRVTRPPEGFGCLTRAQLAAVPHHLGTRTARGSMGGEANDILLAEERKRAPRVDLRADGVTVVDEEESQCPAYAFSPARMRVVKRFSGSGSGQVVNGLNAHGGL